MLDIEPEAGRRAPADVNPGADPRPLIILASFISAAARRKLNRQAGPPPGARLDISARFTKSLRRYNSSPGGGGALTLSRSDEDFAVGVSSLCLRLNSAELTKRTLILIVE
ncbi:hypothetical protein EVAR_84432_1 [Eumeta japonica]|uniref:Uncharacterized protein n=1 Tax=Eumeta variegata TaxID=151549 RepID=A0A4C1W1J9_EUMVA|nr:hypothetical protein EVAR_84432_1 [Eumeta japonica]